MSHPAPMTSIYRTTHSMCWLVWPWLEQTRNTAPSHRSRPARLQFRTPPTNVSTIEVWETTHTTTDDATFYADDEPRRVFWGISSSDTFDSNEPTNVSIASSPSSTPPPPRRQKRKLSIGMFFSKRGECRITPVRHAASPY